MKKQVKSKISIFLISFLYTFGSVTVAASDLDVAQKPLALGEGNSAGSLALVPSVEYPTVTSLANPGDFNEKIAYSGYFDNKKCYRYDVYDGISANKDKGGYFTPVKMLYGNSSMPAHQATCMGDYWHGNFLNWALTSTIDPFRSALTGGYRDVDSKELTILQKARNPRNEMGNRDNIDNKQRNLIEKYTPSVQGMNSRYSLKKIMMGGRDSSVDFIYRSSLDPAGFFDITKSYNVRVEVCKKGFEEENCKKYPSGNSKPEGLIQEYANNIRFSVFSYLNIFDESRKKSGKDGGVMRAAQKFVGPKDPSKPIGSQTNLRAEWDEYTGVFKTHPDKSYNSGKTAGPIAENSGVINYINKFGELTDEDLKRYDSVSLLYYTALRYFKNEGNVDKYSDISGLNEAAQLKAADGFPIITQWDDPITSAFSCQKNAILGIGDVNTHYDKDIPKEYHDYTQKVLDLEGTGKKAGDTFTGNNNNSAHIAGLAYYANTEDIRIALPGKQTVQTYWVDVRERGELRNRKDNQYWLAAKYGGFEVPEDYSPLSNAKRLPEILWAAPVGNAKNIFEVLEANDKGENDKRPKNFFVASDASKMKTSLKEAFQAITRERKVGLTAMVSSSPQAYETNSLMFQSTVDASFWSGDLIASKLSSILDQQSGGEVKTLWSAATKLSKKVSDNGHDARKIYTSLPLSTNNMGVVNKAVAFTANNIRLQGWTADHVNYLRGDSSKEISLNNTEGKFRQRTSLLGDITNSQPEFYKARNQGYSRLDKELFKANQSYTGYLSNQAEKQPLVAVGANDGMLHIFNANTGDEIYAYIPGNVLNKTLRLTEPSYQHEYFVDASPRIGHALIDGNWKTLLAGSTGAGGNSVFVLDVTHPEKMGESSLLWEFTDPDLGGFNGRPSIVALPNGEFGVVFSSGVNRVNPSAGYIWVLNAKDGSLIKKFKLDTQGDLGEPLVTARYNEFVTANDLFVGDTLGNLWHLDISKPNVSEWRVHYNNKPMMVAMTMNNERQPITAPLEAAYSPDGKMTIVFGTGSYYKYSDRDLNAAKNSIRQSVYGIVPKKSEDQYIAYTETEIKKGITQFEVNKELESDGFVGRTLKKRLPTSVEPSVMGSWRFDAPSPTAGTLAERFLNRAIIVNGVVNITSFIPDSSPCGGLGSMWNMSFSVQPDKKYHEQVLDLKASDNNYITGFMLDATRGFNLGGGTLTGNQIMFSDGARLVLKEATFTQKTQLKPGRLSWYEEQEGQD